MTDDPVPLARGLDQLLRGLGAPRAKAIAAVFEHWEEIVGTELAPHTEVTGVENGRVTVAVDDPAWADQLKWKQRAILEAVGEAVGPEMAVDLVVRVTLTGGS